MTSKERLKMLLDGEDMYNPKTEKYVFLYSEESSIAVYNITEEKAKKLIFESLNSKDYWGALLGVGGNIYEKDEVENWAMDEFSQEGWQTVKEYTESIVKEITIVVPQLVKCSTYVDYSVPYSVVSLGEDAIFNYIKEKYDEIPGGDIEPENCFDWELDEDYLKTNIYEAMKEAV